MWQDSHHSKNTTHGASPPQRLRHSPSSHYTPLFSVVSPLSSKLPSTHLLSPLLRLTEDQVNNKNCCTPSKCLQLLLKFSFIYLALTLSFPPSLSLFTPLRAGLSRLPHSSAILDGTCIFLPWQDKIRSSPALMCIFKACGVCVVCVFGLNVGCWLARLKQVVSW